MRFKRALKRGGAKKGLKRVLNRRFNRASLCLGEGNWQGTLQPLRVASFFSSLFFFEAKKSMLKLRARPDHSQCIRAYYEVYC